MPETMGLQQNESGRDAIIVRTSIVGIVANLLLAGFKAAVGLLSNSIAIVLDAVNNLSDALSSIITIIGTKLAGKTPDRNHPYGHGRIEYITTIVIAVIVLWAGITALQESIERIINPETANYEAVTLIIVAVAVVAKIVLGRYVKGKGEEVDSGTLIASGTDALMDAIISASTLVAAFIYIFAGISLEAWLGAIISFVIIKAGYDILREAVDKILGTRVDSEVARDVKDAIMSVDGVKGAYDLVLHDYGPQRLSGSVHVEAPEDMTIQEFDALSRRVQQAVAQQTGVLVHTVGVYASNENLSPRAQAIRDALDLAVAKEPHILQVHGFYVDEQAKFVNFDLIVGFDDPNRYATFKSVLDEMKRRFPDYRFNAVMDSDISD
ncbi:MAG: cation diffusion facilitator family transporter [Coriobacteriia bacterium]|nr:cation diffusion facilitator family transporter [Coriobacteriia bacterium]